MCWLSHNLEMSGNGKWRRKPGSRDALSPGSEASAFPRAQSLSRQEIENTRPNWLEENFGHSNQMSIKGDPNALTSTMSLESTALQNLIRSRAALERTSELLSNARNPEGARATLTRLLRYHTSSEARAHIYVSCTVLSCPFVDSRPQQEDENSLISLVSPVLPGILREPKIVCHGDTQTHILRKVSRELRELLVATTVSPVWLGAGYVATISRCCEAAK